MKSGAAAQRRRACGAWIALMLGALSAPSARAHDGEAPSIPDAALQPIDQALTETAKGHGSVSLDYQNTFVNGFRATNDVMLPIGTVRIDSLLLNLDYYFADRWSLHVGLPFVRNRYTGAAPHCPTTAPPQCQGQPALSPQHPESRFLDDGRYHGTWQDWSVGVAYHTHIGDYYLTPSLTASLPSHDYTFFANAAVGQDLWQVQPAIELAHQFAFSNIYYRIRYGYVFAERTLDTSINHHRLDLELGYFLNDKWSFRAYSIAKKGHGYLAEDLLPITQGQTNAYWYHHDQISRHDYAAVGAGSDYRFADHYTLSASAQKLIWGQTVFNFRYSLDVQLTRDF
ncbi:MAG: hypothetical protein ACHP7D_02350 [Lysobacterales bacterium]